MRKRPTILVIMGVLLALLGLAAPIQILIFDPNGLDPVVLVTQLTWFQWVVMALSLTASALVLQASHWVRIILPVLTFIVLGHHLIHWHDNDLSMMSASVAMVGFVALNVPLLHPNVLSLMSFPERRWWRTSIRKHADLPIYLGGCLKGEMRSRTFELSETGAFIVYPPGPRTTFQVDEIVSICLTLGVLNQIRCTGRVVRVAEPMGTYPAGVAIEFTSLSWGSKRDIRRFISQE